jgi:hypothetical protein
MRPLSAAELLAVWESGLAQPPAWRPLALLAAAGSGAPTEELAALSVGARDGALLDLREQTFGPRLTGVAACPTCAERLEFELDIAGIRVAPGAAAGPSVVEAGGYEVAFRLPNTLDLVAAAESADSEAARRLLFDRCVVVTSGASGPLAAVELPAAVVEQVTERMAAADPQADVSLALACPACDQTWTAPFDIAGYFWTELSAWAERLLSDVCALAAAYGWREADIVAMSPPRRQYYLEAVRR